MILIELKPDSFTYCGKKYEQKRYVSSDFKFLITIDGLDYARAYKANDKGKGERIYLKPKGINEDRFPFSSVEAIKKELEEQQPECEFTLVIHETQFKNNSKPIL